MMDDAINTAIHVARGVRERIRDNAERVSKNNPTKKSRKTKTERGSRSGKTLTRVKGAERNSHATIPQREIPREVNMIDLFQ